MYGCCQVDNVGGIEVCMACFPFVAYGGACYEVSEKGKLPKAVLGAILQPCAGCYIRNTYLKQNACEACVLEFFGPFSCAPCQMASIATTGIQSGVEL